MAFSRLIIGILMPNQFLMLCHMYKETQRRMNNCDLDSGSARHSGHRESSVRNGKLSFVRSFPLVANQRRNATLCTQATSRKSSKFSLFSLKLQKKLASFYEKIVMRKANTQRHLTLQVAFFGVMVAEM
jgi:hypothetical protein